MSESTPQVTEASAVTAAPVEAPKEPWTDPCPGRPVPFWASLRQDIVAHVWPHLPRSWLSWFFVTLRIILFSPGFRVTFLYRFNHMIVRYTGSIGKVVAGCINWLIHVRYLTSISPAARLFGGLILPHPQNIIIGHKVVMGPCAWIYPNVTIAGIANRDGEPSFGRDARINNGAMVCGPYTFGDRVEIAPNSLVQRNVPSDCLAVGVPANIFPRFSKPKT